MTIPERIKNYLGNGGLFNPEHMEHDRVRDLLMDCRTEIDRLHSSLRAKGEFISKLAYDENGHLIKWPTAAEFAALSDAGKEDKA